MKKWEGRSDYDGVILLKSERRPECWNVMDDPENKIQRPVSDVEKFAQ